MERSVYENMAQIDRNHWWFAARRRIISGLIERQAKPREGARILEVGCGTGSNLELLARYGAVEAIEPDDATRAFAAERSGLPIASGTLPGGAAIDDGAYDLVALFDVLEHIPDDRGALAELAAKIAPGGRLLMTVPAMPWLWSAHDVAHHHHRRYTAQSLRAVLDAAGLEPLYLSYFNTFLFPLVAAARGWGKLRGREGGDDAIPSPLINRALQGIFATERHLVPRLPLPFGVSLAVVAAPRAAVQQGALAA
jgi:SAM-dependent methyltransferase